MARSSSTPSSSARWTPLVDVGGDDVGLDLEPFEIGVQQAKTLLRDVDRGDVKARGRELRGLSTGSCAKVGDIPAG